MAILRLPESVLETLKKVFELSGDVFETLIKGLENIGYDLVLDEGQKSLESFVTTKIDAETLQLIFYMLYGFSKERIDEQVPIKQLCDDILKVIRDDSRFNIAPNNESEKSSKSIIDESRLLRILSIDAITRFVKARRLLVSNGKSFKKAELFTDLRSVFAPETNSLLGGVIVHNLRILYQEQLVDGIEEARKKDIYIALDTNDIDTMINMLNRAKEKATIIKEKIGNSEFPILYVGSDENEIE